jgi:O-acetyl-ADP-ribose deacetylase (regulator of RNase III)
MIYSKKINLLNWFDEQPVSCGIIHQCNCFHTMGAGIAKQIALRYPEAVEADRETRFGSRDKLGTFSVAITSTAPPEKRVYNLYGQFDFGTDSRKTSYDALVDGLAKVKSHAIGHDLTRIGIPHNIGCKLGGGNWSLVYKIVADTFQNESGLDLFICEYDP